MITISVGDKPWYLYRCVSTGLTHQRQVCVVDIRGDRAKIKNENGRLAWVKIKNLRLTP